MGVQEAYAKVGKHPGRVMHVTFSAPESSYDEFIYEVALKKCIGFSKMIGVLGGSVIFHPFRIKKEYHKPLFDALKGLSLPGGIWRAVHDNLLGLDTWRDYVYFAPHFHVLGYYPKIIMKSDVFHNVTGWVYKAVGVAQQRNVYRTARYLLTHHAVPEGHKQAVHYFGISSYSKTSVESVKFTSFKSCPDCGSEDYFLLSCGSYMFNRYLEGLRPEISQFGLHVRLVKKMKKYTVRSLQLELAACGVLA